MITREDLEQAICECQAERTPNSNTCIKLAAFLTIKNCLFSQPQTSENFDGYSYAPPPDEFKVVSFEGDSDFAKAINGTDEKSAWRLMDELMSTIKVVIPRLYDGVMRKIKSA